MSKGDVNVESSQFELISGNITRTSPVDVLQLKTEVCSVARSPDEHTLAFGCIDGSVLLHSHSASILVKALFVLSSYSTKDAKIIYFFPRFRIIWFGTLTERC